LKKIQQFQVSLNISWSVSLGFSKHYHTHTQCFLVFFQIMVYLICFTTYHFTFPKSHNYGAFVLDTKYNKRTLLNCPPVNHENSKPE
jgi:hypothetical protein